MFPVKTKCGHKHCCMSSSREKMPTCSLVDTDIQKGVYLWLIHSLFLAHGLDAFSSGACPRLRSFLRLPQQVTFLFKINVL